jgi:hypothetical protein
MRFNVVSAQRQSYWYSDRIGEIFEVEEVWSGNVNITLKVVEDDGNCRFLHRSDVESIRE